MKERSVKGLPKSKDTKHARQQGRASARQRQCELKRGAVHTGSDQRKDRKDLTTEQKERRDSDQTRRAEAFASISGESTPHLCSGRKHATAGNVRRVKEIGPKPG